MVKKGYEIGVDLGTVNTLVYVRGRGIVYNEPSIVAFDKQTNKPIAIGKDANEMLGKEHVKINVVKPLEGGVISDFTGTKVILESVLNKLKDDNVDIKKSTLLICCPSEMTTSERKALKDLGKELNINDVFVEQEVKAGAIGAGIDIFQAKGSMIIDIGGGSTDIGVLSLGDLVVWDSIRIAGRYFDNEIRKYVKYKYGMEIGEKTAEKIKISLGTLRPDLMEDKEYVYAGRNASTNLPSKNVIKQSEVRMVLLKAFESITAKVLRLFQDLPPELSADILERGIVVNGGGALIDGIKEYFEKMTGLKVSISENPLTSIAEGTKILLKNRGNYLVKPID